MAACQRIIVLHWHSHFHSLTVEIDVAGNITTCSLDWCTIKICTVCFCGVLAVLLSNPRDRHSVAARTVARSDLSLKICGNMSNAAA